MHCFVIRIGTDDSRARSRLSTAHCPRLLVNSASQRGSRPRSLTPSTPLATCNGSGAVSRGARGRGQSLNHLFQR